MNQIAALHSDEKGSRFLQKLSRISEVNFITPWKPSSRLTELFEFGLHRTGIEKADIFPIGIGLYCCIEVVRGFRKIAKICC
jgi:hypothetical protein